MGQDQEVVRQALIRLEAAGPGPLAVQTVCVLGYGNQGRAHALNLRDSGIDVVVAGRQGPGRAKAGEDGFETMDTGAGLDHPVVAVCLPDEHIGDVLSANSPSISKETCLVFLHGFAVTYGLVPAFGGAKVLVSPVGPGTAVREAYVAGKGIPALVAAEPAEALDTAIGYAWAIGAGRAAVLQTTFREETECDLFGEQAVLCGGMPELARAAWQTLVNAGYPPELAYLECVQQLRLLAELVAQVGVEGMRRRISDTAEWGSRPQVTPIIGKETEQLLQSALDRVRSGEFARGWLEESARDKERLKVLRSESACSPFEDIGRKVRGLFEDE